MALSEQALREHRTLLREILRLANSDLVALWRLAADLDQRGLFSLLSQGVPEIVEAYRAAAVDVGVLFYDQTQDLVGSSRLVTSVAAVNHQQVESALRWAVFSPHNKELLSLIAGIVQRHVVDGSRDYGIAAANQTGQVWVRAAHPGACNFCRLLATRGLGGSGGYTSANTAVSVGGSSRGHRRRRGRDNQPTGGSFHDNCMCVPVLQSEYRPPSYVLQWERDYRVAFDAAKDKDIYSVLSEMRSVSGHRH